MDKVKMMEFLEKRTAKISTGETIALPAGARNFAGKILTESQEHYVRTTNGCVPAMHARMFLNSLRADMFELDEKTIKLFTELRNKLDSILTEVLS